MPIPARTTRKLWTLASLPLAALAFIASGPLGCDSLGEEMAGLTDGFKQTSPSEAARFAVDPTDADKRREGITLLGNAPFGGVEVYVNLFRDSVLNERDPIVKAAAIQALGKHGDPSDAPRIAPHLTHDNEQVRWASAKALQRLHNPAVVPDLLKSLANEEENRDVRTAVAQALGQYPEDRVFQALVGALNARELAVNEAAEQSLTTLTGMAFNLNAPDWLTWYGKAIAAGSPFAQQQEYLYPTYTRDVSWYEKIVFWKPKVWERPAPPAGLEPEGGRRTYEDSSAPSSDASTAPATQRSTYGDSR